MNASQGPDGFHEQALPVNKDPSFLAYIDQKYLPIPGISRL